ncbi:MAG: hypothetical protein GX777_10245, partial [Fastidiosipila sp.]|nr:hypothetical protein [Fastidiosipila sp.]
MKKNIIKSLLSLILSFSLFITGLGLTVHAADNRPMTDLENLIATVTQSGVEIPESGTINSELPIGIKVSFDVPVIGDEPEPPNPISHRDSVLIPLSSAFTLTTSVPSGGIALKDKSDVLVGHVTFFTDTGTGKVTALVTFDGEASIFEQGSSNVKVEFSAQFQYAGSGGQVEEGDYDVTILEKTYTVNVPPERIDYTVTKSGEVDLDKKEITWTVTINAQQGSTNVDLSAYKFFDNLSDVGVYIAGSFKVKTAEVQPDYTDNILSYSFPANTSGEQTIEFKTSIPDDKYYANLTEQTVRNVALLKDSQDKDVASDYEVVSFKPEWITKESLVEGDSISNTGIYDAENRTITWFIYANKHGASLNGVKITDVLTEGLTFSSATLYKRIGESWDGGQTISEPTDGVYDIGNITTEILLKIVTTVDDKGPVTKEEIYTNSATITWDQGPIGGVETGGIEVGLGYNAIEKEGVADTVNQRITWTVKVNRHGQEIENLKVYDLLVYGKNKNENWEPNDLEFPDGISIDVTELTPQYGQKYVSNSFVPMEETGLVLKVHSVKQNGIVIADLLEVTLPDTGNHQFSFTTQVVDPDIFAGNKHSVVHNTATLFGNNIKLNSASDNVDYNSDMLLKQMLEREAMSDPIEGKNSYTSNVSKGFDYSEKSVIFRLNVNADGINLTGAENAAGQQLGDATLTDTLPKGWEFVDFDQGLPFLIFKGSSTDGKIVIAGAELTEQEKLDIGYIAVSTPKTDTEGAKATFTFTKLDQPYVILLKAMPTDETVAGYFDSNESNTVRNNVNLKTKNWTPGVNDYQDVKIDSNVLTKGHSVEENGVLLWTVEYRPYDLGAEFGLKGQELVDEIQLGIDLRMDAQGQLILDGNITAYMLTLKADGSYELGDSVALTLGTNVIYDNEVRTLTFVIPDSAEAYRFSYITDVTGDPGTSIKNTVRLMGGTEKLEDTEDTYEISDQDGSASFLRSGWIQIFKIDGSVPSVPIAGVKFTLFDETGMIEIKKGITNDIGELRLKIIPDGSYILRETKDQYGNPPRVSIDYSVVVVTDPVTKVVTTSVDGKTGQGSNLVTIQNFEEGTAGNLSIKKTVAGDGADENKLFEFTFYLESAVAGEGVAGPFTYIGHGVTGGEISSRDSISLAHGQSIT